MSAPIESLTGSVITLKLAVEDDAAFIWGLRNDARYNSHLSTTTGTVEDQQAWLRTTCWAISSAPRRSIGLAVPTRRKSWPI